MDNKEADSVGSRQLPDVSPGKVSRGSSCLTAEMVGIYLFVFFLIFESHF